MKKLLILVVFALSFTGVTLAQAFETQPSKEYVAELQKMLNISGADATFKVVIPQMFAMMKQNAPQVPAEYWDVMQNELSKFFMEDLVHLLAPIYQKYLTLSDLKELIKFYQTPIGKKLAAMQPALTSESMMVGQQWGMKIATRVQEALKAKGYL